jgi:hypothetical protein
MTTNRAGKLDPIVLQASELAAFVQRLLAHHAPPTNVIVCSSQEVFFAQLQASIIRAKEVECTEAQEAGASYEKVSRIASRAHELLIPTINQLLTSRTISVTFCATLAQLQAYLGVYGVKKTTEPVDEGLQASKGSVPTLAMINPLAIHKQTSSFSAQGLSRTFASAVEAARRSKQKLVIVECPCQLLRHPTDTDEGEDEEVIPVEGGLALLNDDVEPWNQQVPILNVTTKSFGAGERGWVGRTVLARRIAERWCVFE